MFLQDTRVSLCYRRMFGSLLRGLTLVGTTVKLELEKSKVWLLFVKKRQIW